MGVGVVMVGMGIVMMIWGFKYLNGRYELCEGWFIFVYVYGLIFYCVKKFKYLVIDLLFFWL